MRIIQVLHHSLGATIVDAEPESGLAGWHELVARELAKRTKGFVIECWRPESTAKQLHLWKDQYGVIHRIFPSIRVRYGVEVSVPMITALERELDTRDKIVLHLHGIYNANTYLLGLLFGGKCPIMVQSHDPLDYVPQGLGQIQFALRKFALRNIGRFLVLSDDELKYFSAMFEASRVRIQPLGIDLKLFRRTSKRKARMKLGWRTDQPYLLYVGRLVERKGLQYLIKAIGILVSRLPHLHLMIVGSGTGGLSRMVDSMNLTGNVTFVGQIKHSALPVYYNAADVFVLPSLREAWPRVVMESLACQTPIIATWTGCVPTLTREGMKGLFVVPMRDQVALANKILQVLQQGTTIRNGISRSKLRQYDWEYTVRGLLEAYKELVGQNY